MDFDPRRLRTGEVIVGASALVLLASIFVLDWYGLNGTLAPTADRLGLPVSVNAWQALTTVRWLLLLTVACALALVYFQASRRAPALPVTLSVILTVLAGTTVLVLIYRVLINPPGPGDVITARAGAYVGLLSALVLVYGAYRSLRQEGIAERDAPAVRLVEGPADSG
jgi:succinate-acetate transporter protein